MTALGLKDLATNMVHFHLSDRFHVECNQKIEFKSLSLDFLNILKVARTWPVKIFT